MDNLLLLPGHSFPSTNIMSISSRILKLLSKLTTKLNFPVAKSADPTPALPSNPVIAHATSSYDPRSQSRYISLASATARGWRVPRYVRRRRSPERHDRHSMHHIAVGILFSAVKLTPGAKRRVRKVWNCGSNSNTRLTKASSAKKQTSEILESDAPIVMSSRDQLSSHPARVGEKRGKAVLSDHTPVHEDLARGCKGDADDWAGNHPKSECWISMKPIAGKT